MAEIRKHNPEAGNAIAQALRAAMGEPVRPNEPGATPHNSPKEAASPPVTVVSFRLETHTTDSAATEDDD